MRIQPSLGVACILFAPSAGVFATGGANTTFGYDAGNWKTAVTGGLGFEFGKNDQRNFVLSINYLKGITNLGQQSITTIAGTKPVTTSFQSYASSCNIRMGIPIAVGKKAPVVNKKIVEKKFFYREEKRYGQYRPQQVF